MTNMGPKANNLEASQDAYTYLQGGTFTESIQSPYVHGSVSSPFIIDNDGIFWHARFREFVGDGNTGDIVKLDPISRTIESFEWQLPTWSWLDDLWIGFPDYFIPIFLYKIDESNFDCIMQRPYRPGGTTYFNQRIYHFRVNIDTLVTTEIRIDVIPGELVGGEMSGSIYSASYITGGSESLPDGSYALYVYNTNSGNSINYDLIDREGVDNKIRPLRIHPDSTGMFNNGEDVFHYGVYETSRKVEQEGVFPWRWGVYGTKINIAVTRVKNDGSVLFSDSEIITDYAEKYLLWSEGGSYEERISGVWITRDPSWSFRADSIQQNLTAYNNKATDLETGDAYIRFAVQIGLTEYGNSLSEFFTFGFNLLDLSYTERRTGILESTDIFYDPTGVEPYYWGIPKPGDHVRSLFHKFSRWGNSTFSIDEIVGNYLDPDKIFTIDIKNLVALATINLDYMGFTANCVDSADNSFYTLESNNHIVGINPYTGEIVKHLYMNLSSYISRYYTIHNYFVEDVAGGAGGFIGIYRIWFTGAELEGRPAQILKHTSIEDDTIVATPDSEQNTRGIFEAIHSTVEPSKVEISKGTPTVVYSVPISGAISADFAGSILNAPNSFYIPTLAGEMAVHDARVVDIVNPEAYYLHSGELTATDFERYIMVGSENGIFLIDYGMTGDWAHLSIVPSGILASGIATQSGVVNAIETTNYTYPNPFIFYSVSGAQSFYQRNPDSFFWTDYSATLPDANITIIRTDDAI